MKKRFSRSRQLACILIAVLVVCLFPSNVLASGSNVNTAAAGVSAFGNVQSGEIPPAKPDGDTQDPGMGTGTNMTPPGENNGMQPGQGMGTGTNTTPPAKPDGDTQNMGMDMGTGTNMTPPGEGNGMQPGQDSQSANISYSSVKEYTSDSTLSSATVSSTGKDENAILISDGKVTLDNVTVKRTSSSSTGGDNSSFYGVGASILNKGGILYITDSTITSDAKGGAGVFSYGTGITYVNNTKITTKSSTSGGIHAAGGGTLYAYDCDVTTAGESSAAIRSDRGGGTMVVDGGSYTSNGTGSPAVYCTADITVNDAALTANNSEGVCIEGLNTLRIYNSTLTCDMPDNSQNDSSWSVILYQSMSGDSQVGCSSFTMDGGKLISKNGGLFYTTNTESSFVLNNVDITASDDSEYFLMCTGNTNARGWGQSGSNGADCTFTGINQEMDGNVIWDSISKLDLYLTDGSALTGAVLDDESYAGSGTGSGYANLYISSDSTWTVTGNSTLSNLYNAGTILDASGKTVTIKDSTGTVVTGDSAYTITVTGTYSTKANLSGAGSIEAYSAHQVTLPASVSEISTNTEASGNASNTDVSESDATKSVATSSDTTSKVSVKKSVIKTAVSKKSKSATVTWKKLSGVTGYQIVYSTSKNFTSKTTSKKTISSASKTSATLSSLKSGKKYYIKVRAYKTVNGKRVYGSYSTVKTIKVK